MKPRTLLRKERLECGCLQYTYRSMPGMQPAIDREFIRCPRHAEVGTVALMDDPCEPLMQGRPKRRFNIPISYEPRSRSIPIRKTRLTSVATGLILILGALSTGFFIVGVPVIITRRLSPVQFRNPVLQDSAIRSATRSHPLP